MFVKELRASFPPEIDTVSLIRSLSLDDEAPWTRGVASARVQAVKIQGKTKVRIIYKWNFPHAGQN